MFDDILETVQKNVSTVSSIIRANEELRKLLFSRDFSLKENEQYYQQLLSIKELVPSETNWRIYDRCSVIIRLYAIYETFVESLIKDWINYLPQIFNKYSDLPEKIQNTHQIGASKLLQNKHRSVATDITNQKIISVLYYAVTENNNSFELLPQAFLIYEQNLRKEILEKLLSEAGIYDSWKWIETNREIQHFVKEILGDDRNKNRAENELKELIDYRNNAAHGEIIHTDEVLNESQLLNLCTFIKVLCQALAELVTYKVIEQQITIGQVKKIGIISRWFENPQACRAKINNTQLSVGEDLFLASKTQAYCKSVKIESIIDEQEMDKQTIDIINEQEIGLKFNSSAKKGLSIFQYVNRWQNGETENDDL